MYVSTQSKKLGMGEWSEEELMWLPGIPGMESLEWNGNGPVRVQYSFIYRYCTLDHGESRPFLLLPES